MKQVSLSHSWKCQSYVVPRTLSSCWMHLSPDCSSRIYGHIRAGKRHQLQALLTPPGFYFGGWAHTGFLTFCTLLKLAVNSVSILSHLCESLGIVQFFACTAQCPMKLQVDVLGLQWAADLNTMNMYFQNLLLLHFPDCVCPAQMSPTPLQVSSLP